MPLNKDIENILDPILKTFHKKIEATIREHEAVPEEQIAVTAKKVLSAAQTLQKKNPNLDISEIVPYFNFITTTFAHRLTISSIYSFS